jgi:shikimate dehydrogenase
MHAAAYRALGLEHHYEPLDCPDEAAVARAFERIRLGEIEGANVTVPHKRLALELADRADPMAEEVGAANVIVRDRTGRLSAHNTDVLALVEELSRLAPAARSVAIIGNGGAALAAVLSCRQLGMDRIGVVARSWRAGADTSTWQKADGFRRMGATVIAWPDTTYSGQVEVQGVSHNAWEAWVTSSDVIVQATSAGMLGGAPGEAVRDIVPWLQLDSTLLAYDVVYNPPSTPFLEAARAAGLKSEGGLGMLIAQASHAFELWLRQRPPREVMRSAAEQALGLGRST